MYFSNNSRCVLRKVRFLSPSFLNKIDKNLSIKKPKDDPTKPPLRINIPVEPAEKDDPSYILRKNNKPAEIRSTGASLSASYPNGVFRKSKSEIHISRVDGSMVEETPEESGVQHSNWKESQTSDSVSYLNVENERNVDVKMRASNGVSFDSINNNNNINFASSKREGKGEKEEAFTESTVEEPANRKSRQLLVDENHKNRGPSPAVREETGSSGKGDSTNSSWTQQSNSETPKSKSDQKKLESSLLQKSKHLSKSRLSKVSGKSSNRLEVREAEDEATYILYMKLNKQLQGKTCGVGCVPEKELTTRTVTENGRDSQNLIEGDFRFKKSFTKELPDFQKLAEARKKQKPRKTQQHTLTAGKTGGSLQPKVSENMGGVAKASKHSQKKELDSVKQGEEEKKKVEFDRHDMGGFKIPVKKFRDPEEDALKSSNPLSPDAEDPYVDSASQTQKVQLPPAITDFFNTSTPVQSNDFPTEKQNTQNVTPAPKEATKTSDVIYFNPHKSLTTQEMSEDSQSTVLFENPPRPDVVESTEVRTTLESQSDAENSNYYVEASKNAEAQSESAKETRRLVESPIESSEKPKPAEMQTAYYNYYNEYNRMMQRWEGAATQDENQVNVSSAEMKEKPREPDEKKYISIHDDPDTPSESPSGKGQNDIWKASGREKSQSESSSGDFQTSGSFVTIGRTESPTYPMTFGAAFPPLLKEALNTQLRLKKSFGEKWKKCEIWSKEGGSKSGESSENSILFPKKETDGFDCECLFSTREQIILNIIKTEEGNRAKCTEKSVDVVKKADDPSDSLTIMKKVKEMVQVDLDNVVKIFDGGSDGRTMELSSVVISKADGWEVNREELESQMAMRRNDVKLESLLNSMKDMQMRKDILRDGTSVLPPKYLPSRKEIDTEIQFPEDQPNSVIMFNPKSNEFYICKKALAEAICRKTNEPLDEITQTLDILANRSESSRNLKRGDSILVFDDETQSWKVDFSILEKRQQQLQLEEELTKRSELILETFEELEKNQTPSIPKPDSKDKKTFDYAKKEWKDLSKSKNPNEKSTKSKSPFKESNAEEIRKKNSDLYENLFMTKKKETRMNAEKKAPGVSSSNSKKESKSADSGEKQESASDTKSTEPSPKGPEIPDSTQKTPPSEKPKPKEDDNFWDAFLKMNILPKDISEIPKLPPVKKPPVTPSTPSSNKAPSKEPVPGTPEKKIENPLLKIPIPFSRRISIIDKIKKKSDGDPKQETTTKTPLGKSEKPGLKGPQPTKDDPKKTDPPKQPPKSEPPKTDPPKQSPPKLDPPKQPPSQPPKFDPPKNKPSTNASGKIQDPKIASGGKMASPTDHYVSDKIIEISRMKGKDQPKIKTNKVETVKLNITVDRRLPSKVTEINLNKKCEKGKIPEVQNHSEDGVKISEESSKEKKPLYKKFEKYQTPFSDPDYEEKSLKIKSDLVSNPNLKKLDNWNKTLVLHDIMKPPENIETWLKDETDKMAALLLKILQEASDGKPKKKLPIKPKSGETQPGKGNPYENIRKKQENTPESFLFRVRTVNLSLENEKNLKSEDLPIKSKRLNDITATKAGKPTKTIDTLKIADAIPPAAISSTLKSYQLPENLEERKNRNFPWGFDGFGDFIPAPKDSPHIRIPSDVTEDIPGPEILKRISNVWKLLPVLDSQITIFTLFRLFQLVNLGRSFLSSSNSDKTRQNAFTKLFSKYGPIVNVKGPLSGNVILIHKPEHLAAVFDQDAPIFVRSVFDSLEQIRKDSEEKSIPYDFSTDWTSPEWADLKRTTNDSSIKGWERYLVSSETAVDSLVGIMRKNRNSQNMVSEDFSEEIKRWSLEGLCSVLFEKSFGFMEGKIPNTSWIMEPDKLYVAVEKATHCLNKCEGGFQMWRLMHTPSAAGLSQAYRSISSIFSKQIFQAGINLKNKNELLRDGGLFHARDLTLVESMLLNDGLSNDEVICNLVDILLIGTNVINSSIGFLLYNLALNVKIQNKLFKELKEVLPNKTTHLDYSKLGSLKYLQACIKENLRLHIPIPIFYRMLQNDILLSNYIIPKGTYMVMDQRVSNQREYVFDEPNKFSPERWESEDKWMQDFQLLSSFPLCHGPRAEFAKKVVELQLLICAAKILRNFRVEYHYGEIQSTNTLINCPDKPLKLNFIERES